MPLISTGCSHRLVGQGMQWQAQCKNQIATRYRYILGLVNAAAAHPTLKNIFIKLLLTIWMLYWLPGIPVCTCDLKSSNQQQGWQKSTWVPLPSTSFTQFAINFMQLTKDVYSRNGQRLCCVLCTLGSFLMVSTRYFTHNRHFDFFLVCAWVAGKYYRKTIPTYDPRPSPLTYPHNIPPSWDTALPCS